MSLAPFKTWAHTFSLSIYISIVLCYEVLLMMSVANLIIFPLYMIWSFCLYAQEFFL